MRNVCLAAVIFLFTIPLLSQETGFIFKPDGSDFYVYGRGTETFILTQSRISALNIDSAIRQMSSGQRLNSAADDPAGRAISDRMETLLKQMRQSSMNDEDMRNFNSFAESAIAQDQEILNRVRELIVRAANGILGPDDREIIQTEIDELLSQIDMNARFSRLNTIAVIPDLTVGKLLPDNIDVVRDQDHSLGAVDNALKKLSRERVLKGVRSNILTFRIEGKSWHYLNFMRTESRILDADMAAGISELVKNSVQLKSRYGLIVRPK
jgi:flagellin